jgi:hypothetical protein
VGLRKAEVVVCLLSEFQHDADGIFCGREFFDDDGSHALEQTANVEMITTLKRCGILSSK